MARTAPRPARPSLGLRRGEVRLVRHRRAWAGAFARERRRLSRLLGPGAVAIEHVGSTAVAGLAAKPVLDIAVAADSPAAAARWTAALEAAGYAAFGDREGRGEDFYARGPEDRRTMYLHVVPAGSPNWARYLAFRDALRSSAPLRARYGRLKRRLASLHPRDRDAYTGAKSAFIRAVLGRGKARCGATR